MHKPQKKSTFEIWQKWAKVLLRQLDQAADVYEYHQENGEAEKLNEYLDRLRLFVDPLAHAPEIAKRDYDVEGGVRKLYLLSLTMLRELFAESLRILPEISEDMQRLLKSPCYGHCNGRTATDLFKGPHGTTNEGIASGIPDERGGLPWMLEKLLDEAEAGGDVYFAEGLGLGEKDGGSDGEQGGGPSLSRHTPSHGKKMMTSGGFA